MARRDPLTPLGLRVLMPSTMVASTARTDALDAALERLSRALDQLEQAAEARSEADVRRAERDEALSVLQDDRSRLAVELDGALARNRSLEKAAEDVSRRLNAADAAVRALLAAAEPADLDARGSR
jgi:chromosome segregation ATPase